MTPTSTYRINRRGGGENGGGGDSRGIRTSSLIQSSMQSTPEANKRDKVREGDLLKIFFGKIWGERKEILIFWGVFQRFFI